MEVIGIFHHTISKNKIELLQIVKIIFGCKHLTHMQDPTKFSTKYKKTYSKLSVYQICSLQFVSLWLFFFMFSGRNLTVSQKKIFRLFQTKRVADDIFKFDENGREFPKKVENTVGKGETDHYEQFLLFQQHFQKTNTADT